ncbi:MAG: hypothetical protein Q9219_003132 [cf. Caloplaca sp. 3 TL-2023]
MSIPCDSMALGFAEQNSTSNLFQEQLSYPVDLQGFHYALIPGHDETNPLCATDPLPDHFTPQDPRAILTRPLIQGWRVCQGPVQTTHQSVLTGQYGKPVTTVEVQVAPPRVAAGSSPQNHIFNLDMNEARKRKRYRRKLSDAEKERAKHVRKMGACIDCKEKKRKCLHVPDIPKEGQIPGLPNSESEDSEPVTPEPASVMEPIYTRMVHDPEDFSFESYWSS